MTSENPTQIKSGGFVGKTLQTGSNKNVTLDTELGSGKEGAVYGLESEQAAVKIFNTDQRTNQIEMKIGEMISNSPGEPSSEHMFFAWPKDIVYHNNQFVGYKMPLVDVDNFSTIRSYITRELSDDPGLSEPKIKLAYNLSTVVDLIHKEGHAVGDFNFQNILVNDGKVTVIDCDSYSICGTNSRQFHGDTMFERHIPPEGRPNSSIQKVQLADYFNLAVWIFRIMTGYLHPYQAKGKLATSGKIVKMMEENPFPFWNPKQDLIEPPVGQSRYDALPPQLRVLFESAFLGGKFHPYKRPSASVWRSILLNLISDNSGENPNNRDYITVADKLSNGIPTPNKKEISGVNVSTTIGSLGTRGEQATVVGSIKSVSRLTQFEYQGETGFVSRVVIQDDTGSIPITFWNKQGVVAARSLYPGLMIKIEGTVKDGFEDDVDIEIHADRYNTYPYTDNCGSKIGSLEKDQTQVHIRGCIISTSRLRSFNRKDGSTGHVFNVQIADKSGVCTGTFWDDAAKKVEFVEPGQTVEIIQGKTKISDGSLEVHVSESSPPPVITDIPVKYRVDHRQISVLQKGNKSDIRGKVSNVDNKRTFEKDNGSQGQVKNIRIEDQTGDLRVALWDNLADYEIEIGDTLFITDVYVKSGYKKEDEIEGSTDSSSTIAILDHQS